MTSSGTGSRRDVVATVASGALFGALWGAAFPIVATERRPTIAVVGHRNAQVVLIDASPARALVLSGEPGVELLDMLPAIMTMFRQRIDLVIGAPSPLADHGQRIAQRWRVGHTIDLRGGEQVPSLWSSTTFVDKAIDIALGSSMELNIRMGFRGQWRPDAAEPDSPLWCATLSTSGGDVVIAPNPASVSAVGPLSTALMIVPDAPDPNVLSASPTSALAVNYDSKTIDEAPAGQAALTRIFPRDVARIVIGDGALHLPEWTLTPGDADTD